jgi:hypothetical protein
MNGIREYLSTLEDYLQELDLKNKIVLYVSVLIFFGIIYYYFNYDYFNSKMEENRSKIIELKRENHFSVKKAKIKLAHLKKELKKLKLEKDELKADMVYLKRKLTLSHLKVDDDKFYSLLEKVLYKSIELDFAPNYLIKKEDKKDFIKYSLDINSSFNICEENKLFNLIKFLESTKYVATIEGFDENNSDFFIRYSIWGVK